MAQFLGLPVAAAVLPLPKAAIPNDPVIMGKFAQAMTFQMKADMLILEALEKAANPAWIINTEGMRAITLSTTLVEPENIITIEWTDDN